MKEKGAPSMGENVITAIYDAALNDDLWPSALEEINTYVGGYFTHMFSRPGSQGASAPSFARISAKAPVDGLPTYHAEYETIDPRLKIGEKLPAGTVTADWQFVDQDDFLKCAFYNEFYAPQGLRWHIAGTIVNSPTYQAFIGFTRQPSDGAFSNDACARASRIMPHLARAIEIRRRLHKALNREEASKDALNVSPHGVVLLSKSLECVFLNDTATAIMAKSDGLTVRQNKLRFASTTQSRAFKIAAEDALRLAERSSLKAPEIVQINRPSGKQAYCLLISPLSQEHDTVRYDGKAVLLAVIVEPDANQPVNTALLQTVYALTDAEAALAKAFGNGLTLSQIAAARNVALSTVRSQLYAVMDKIEVSRQTELMRKLDAMRCLPGHTSRS